MSDEKQPDMFSDPEALKAELVWFHVFRALIHSDIFPKMQGSAVKVYLVIKAHANFNTGASFPSLETIAEKAGYSVAQVKRALKELEGFDLIAKDIDNKRHNTYRLRERIVLENADGEAQALATFEYTPANIKRAIAEVRNVIMTGEMGNTKLVHIERLQININNLRDNAVNFNVQQFLADIEKLPKHLRQAAKDAIDRAEGGSEPSF